MNILTSSHFLSIPTATPLAQAAIISYLDHGNIFLTNLAAFSLNPSSPSTTLSPKVIFLKYNLMSPPWLRLFNVSPPPSGKRQNYLQWSSGAFHRNTVYLSNLRSGPVPHSHFQCHGLALSLLTPDFYPCWPQPSILPFIPHDPTFLTSTFPHPSGDDLDDTASGRPSTSPPKVEAFMCASCRNILHLQHNNSLCVTSLLPYVPPYKAWGQRFCFFHHWFPEPKILPGI